MQPLMGIEPLNARDCAFMSTDLKGAQTSFPVTAFPIDFQTVERFSALLEEGSAFNQEALSACEHLIARGTHISSIKEEVCPSEAPLPEASTVVMGSKPNRETVALNSKIVEIDQPETLVQLQTSVKSTYIAPISSSTVSMVEGEGRPLKTPLPEAPTVVMGSKPNRETVALNSKTVEIDQPETLVQPQTSVKSAYIAPISFSAVSMAEGEGRPLKTSLPEVSTVVMGSKPNRETVALNSKIVEIDQPETLVQPQTSVKSAYVAPISSSAVSTVEGEGRPFEAPLPEASTVVQGAKPNRETVALNSKIVEIDQPEIFAQPQTSAKSAYVAPISSSAVSMVEGEGRPLETSLPEVSTVVMGSKPKLETVALNSKIVEIDQPETLVQPQTSVKSAYVAPISSSAVSTVEGEGRPFEAPLPEASTVVQGAKPNRETVALNSKIVEIDQPEIFAQPQTSAKSAYVAPISSSAVSMVEGEGRPLETPLPEASTVVQGAKPNRETASLHSNFADINQSQVLAQPQIPVISTHVVSTSSTIEEEIDSITVSVQPQSATVSVEHSVVRSSHPFVETPLQAPKSLMTQEAQLAKTIHTLPHTAASIMRTEESPKVVIMPNSTQVSAEIKSEIVVEKVPERSDVEVRGRDGTLANDVLQVIAPTMMPIVLPHLTAEVASPQVLSYEVVQQFVLAAQAVADAILVSSGFVRGEGQLLIRLQPDVLGGSEVRLVAQSGELTVVINPASSDVSTIVEANRTQFEQYLAEKIHSWRISVAVKRGGHDDERL